MASTQFKVCGHCDKSLGEKAYSQHRRLFWFGGEWIREDIEQGTSSRSSSPITLSEPDSSLDGNPDDGVLSPSIYQQHLSDMELDLDDPSTSSNLDIHNGRHSA